MNITKGIRIIDLALYLEKHNALVIGDVHLGYEEAMNRQGVLLPRFQFRDTMARLEGIFSKLEGRLSEVIINGDLKHEFGGISEQEWREILKLIDYLLEKAGKVVLVKGNHDVILGPIARKRNIELKEYHFADGAYISHGHVIPSDEDFRKAKLLIIGDEHPAVTIRSGARAELYKCFLKGKWKDKELVVMPSFNQVTIGSDILKEKFLSPFLERIGDFEVYVAGDEIYPFGKAKDIAR
ncbi:metallophosphoesterase [Candidatus Woesearchaeota archaeon]|nr:metallophosphoesterase [Candidatus Woesearchaeota archaeon]